jgi:hypothetical protein
MNAHEFEVIATRHFITLTERDSKRVFRIPVSDAILVGGFAGPNWRTGDVVKLSEPQQKILAEADARCCQMGDEAGIRETKVGNKLGCLAWIVILVVVVTLIVWWLRK